MTPGDVASGTVAIDQRVQDLVEDFWKYHLNWINNAAQEVRMTSVVRSPYSTSSKTEPTMTTRYANLSVLLRAH
jgi:hypothetical protein